MSRSLSTEPSDEGLFRHSSEGATPRIPDERTPTQAADQLPEVSNQHAPDATLDPQPDNRLSLVSSVSLEPRRRSRHHHHSRHSHLHRELAHMLSISSRDTKELRRGLNSAFDKLDQSRSRASRAEKLALEMLLRVREAEEERTNAMRQASTVREDLGKHKALLDNAHGEIRRAQQMLQDQEQLRYEAEASAARARDNARQMKQKRLIELAREQGRKMGFDEGIQAGQRIGYNEGQRPIDDGEFYPNEEPRFRELFESRYQLDDIDQSPTSRNIHLDPSSSHIGEPLPTPLPRPQVYPRLQVPRAETLAPANNVTNVPPEAPYIPVSSPMGIPRTSSTGSSSTTTLPAAPSILHVSSRGPPPMPTIPEVSSTEVGSSSRVSRSSRDSPRAQNHTPPVLNFQHTDVVPSVVPLSQNGAAFVPPPGIIESTPSGPVSGYPAEPGSPIYKSPSPHRAFSDPWVLDNGIIPDESRSPVQESFPPVRGATQGAAREQFETPGDIPSPVQERFTATSSPRTARTYPDGIQLARDLQSPEFSTRLSSRPSAREGPSPWRDGPPKRRPIPQMPAPLAPQSSANPPYTNISHSTVPRMRPSESDNRMPRHPSLNGAANSTPNWYPSSQQIIPNYVERSADRMPEQRSRAMSPPTFGDQAESSGTRYPRPATAPRSFTGDASASQPTTSQNLLPRTHTYQADGMPEQRSRAMSPPSFSDQAESSGTHYPPPATAPRSFTGDPSASQPTTSQNLPPRTHVQIPPTRYYTPAPASPRSATPVTPNFAPPANVYSPRATSPTPNINASDLANQSPRRFPPTILQDQDPEPNLQRRPTIMVDYEQEGRASTPVLPVPSRNSRSTSPRMVPPPADSHGRNSYAAGQRTPIASPDDTLPVRPPSVSPRPSPAAFVQRVPSQGGVTHSTPRRSASPNPLPRGASPAPLPRASSPAPLPIRSPSMRSVQMRRNPSDVSLPGAPGSAYMHYNPNLDADIAVLASSSADQLTAVR
ncbi:hypothetical protein BC827DRAFT_1181273 [Russula dissimulans]|nr:hypothetical protein BC827DRAFT_1181273 [Russula dissimulans]